MTPEDFTYLSLTEFRKFVNKKHYVASKSNPADIASRGAGAQELIDNCLWWSGPDFIWNSSEGWNTIDDIPAITPDDPEVKSVTVRAPRVQKPPSLLERLIFLQLAPSEETAVCLRLQKRFRKTSASDPQDREERQQRKPSYNPVYVQELYRAELHSIKLAENEAFPDEIKRLKSVNTEAQVADQNTVKGRNRQLRCQTYYTNSTPS